MLMYLEVLAGFVLLLGGAEIMVRGAVSVSERFGISKLVIGMTVVAFGTSAPELLVSLNAALSGASGLAIGNVVGSNIVNILLVLGVSGLILPIVSEKGSLVKDGVILLVGTGAFMLLSFQGTIDLTGGIILIVLFVAFLYYSYRREAGPGDDLASDVVDEVSDLEVKSDSIWVQLAYLFGGFAGLTIGSEFLVDGGVEIARHFGVSEAVIGLTIIAFGTSLPELAASAMAAFRKHSDVALGNVVGSNIFNVVGIVGIVAIVTPLEVPYRVLSLDNWAMLLATLLMMPFMIGGMTTINRPVAGLFFLIYVGYIVSIGFGVTAIF
jgi:cation:H+ antiporter